MNTIQKQGFNWVFSMAAIFGLAGVSSAMADVPPLKSVQIGGRVVLATSAGRTVYIYDHDTTSDSTCYGVCAFAWPAVTTAAADLKAPLGRSTRQDGSQQITYNGHPLYLYIGDAGLGDTRGDGLGGIWHIITNATVPAFRR